MLRIIGKRNSPFQRDTADGEISQAGLHKRNNFIPASLPPDEFRILFVKLEQGLLEGGELKEITFFGKPFRLTAAIGARHRRAGITFRSVSLAGHTIPAGIRA